MFMLCTFLVFYFCAASHGVIKNDNAEWKIARHSPGQNIGEKVLF